MSYTLTIAADNDMVFTGGTSITSCIGFNCFVGGFGKDRLPSPGKASIQVYADSPESGNLLLVPGLFLQLSAGSVILYTGIIESVNFISPHIVEIACVTRWAFSGNEVNLPYLTDVRANDIIDTALYHSLLPQGRNRDGSPLFVIDTDMLDDGILYHGIPGYSLDTGSDVWEYFGDYREFGTLEQIVRECTIAEWGLFLECRNGDFLWKNRGSLYEVTPDITITDTQILDTSYRYDTDITAIRIQTMSREVNTGIVWTANTRARFVPGYSARTVRVDFDGSLPVGAADLVASFTWVRDNETVSDVHYELVEQGASILIEVFNPGSAVYLSAGSTISGTYIRHRVVSFDDRAALSSLLYGTHQTVITLPLSGDTDTTLAIASWYLAANSALSGKTLSLSLVITDAVIQQDIGSIIRVNSTHLSHDEIYLLTGYECHMKNGIFRHIWHLMPLSEIDVFDINTDEINGSSLIAL